MTSPILYNQELVAGIQQEQGNISQDLHSLLDYLRWAYSCFNASDIFHGHGHDNPWDEVVQLVLSTLHLPIDLPVELYANSRLTQKERQHIIHLVIERLGTRKPIAYLTNTAWFCGLEFYVDERVIVPRSPIAELIQNGFTGFLKSEPKQILDLCTGSGCIAIACAEKFPNTEIDAVDISDDALQVTEINIDRHNVNDQVFPFKSDLFNDLVASKYDLIVSNPPYVDAEDLADMPAEFFHEPELALGAGQDGLVLVKRILAQAADFLNDNGVLICEVGNSMVHLIEQFPNVPFEWLKFQHGGDGIFMLTKDQLLSVQDQFASYR